MKILMTILLLACGRGGSNPSRSAGNVIPAGGSVWTFALTPD